MLKLCTTYITENPEKWQGYHLLLINLLSLKRLEEAKKQIKIALHKFPSQSLILVTAVDIYIASDEYEKCLELSEILLAKQSGLQHEYLSHVYMKAAMSLKLLRRFK